VPALSAQRHSASSLAAPPGQREAWVDFAKGICIIAVVSLYAHGQLRGLAAHTGWLDHWVAFAKPFRMPDFFLLSGLFLARVIERPWLRYLDTKVVHYGYFLLLWIVIFLPVSWQEAPWALSASGLVKHLLYQLMWPHAMLWFILMLAIFFVFTRLLRFVPQWIMLVCAVALHLFVPKTGVHLVDEFCARFVFFFAGYMFADRFFDLAGWARRHPGPVLLTLAAWAVINGWLVSQGYGAQRMISLLLGFAGACAVICIGSLLSAYRRMHWLRYIGQHSIVVYLGFYLPLLALVWLGGKAGLAALPGLFGLAVIALSILSAFALFWTVRGTWAGFLFERPRWAHLDFWLGERAALATRGSS
jgi:uncharacterized membrane protein YcfT